MQLHIFVMSGSESGRSDPISGYSAEHSQVTASLAFIVTTAEKTTTYKSSIRRLWAPTWDFFCSVSLFFWQCHLMSFVLRFILFFSSFCFFDSFYGGDIWHLQLLNSRCREEWTEKWTKWCGRGREDSQLSFSITLAESVVRKERTSCIWSATRVQQKDP